MSTGLAPRAAALRGVFDSSFALPPAVTQAHEDFLAIRLGDAPYALRLADIVAVSTDHRIAALPEQAAALLGLSGFRGTLLPVYGLAALLGHESALPARWVVRTAAMAFAFTRLDGHLRLPGTRVLATSALRPESHVSGFLQLEDHIRPVLDMGSLIEAVRILAGATMMEDEAA